MLYFNWLISEFYFIEDLLIITTPGVNPVHQISKVELCVDGLERSDWAINIFQPIRGLQIIFTKEHFFKGLIPSFRRVTFLKIGPFPASFSLYSSFQCSFLIQLTVNKIADDWIRTPDLWCRNRSTGLTTVSQPLTVRSALVR